MDVLDLIFYSWLTGATLNFIAFSCYQFGFKEPHTMLLKIWADDEFAVLTSFLFFILFSLFLTYPLWHDLITELLRRKGFTSGGWDRLNWREHEDND